MFDRSVLWSNDAHAARGALETLLTECQGNVTLASRRAGIERQSMHRLLKRHGLDARDFRPRGGGSIIARAALKNLDQQLTPPQRSRELSRTVVREVAVRRPGVTVTHPAAIEQDVRGVSPRGPRPGGAEASRERAVTTVAASVRERAPLRVPDPLASPSFERASDPARWTEPRRDRASLASPSFERASDPARWTEPRRDRASLASPSFERTSEPPRRPTEPLIERPITAGELADRAFERHRAAVPHHRPYQSPLGAAALHALALRKTAG